MAARGSGGRPFQAGHDPRRDLAKARAGRKPDKFIAECDKLTDDEVLPKLRAKLCEDGGGPNDAGWRWAADKVMEYSKRKAAQRVEVELPEDQPLPPGRLSRDEIEAEVRRLLTARSN